MRLIANQESKCNRCITHMICANDVDELIIFKFDNTNRHSRQAHFINIHICFSFNVPILRPRESYLYSIFL